MSLQRNQRHISQRLILSLVVIGILCHLVLCQDQTLFESIESIPGKALKGFVYKVINGVKSYFECFQACEENVFCSSVNYYASKGVCELSHSSHLLRPDKMTNDSESSYFLNPFQQQEFTNSSGQIPELPAQNCRVLSQTFPWLPSGKYWLDVDISGPWPPFLGYCDMDTDGGGWTLVWAFTFSMYNDFKNKGNYVKPMPMNMFTTGQNEESNTPPQNESDMNAMDLNMWREIGSEFLVKSNINNWVACLPGAGSLVTKTEGSLNCRFIKQVVYNSPLCNEIPGEFVKMLCGYSLLAKSTSKYLYYFDKCDNRRWPIHDPCGMNQANHKQGVDNPHTNLYIR